MPASLERWIAERNVQHFRELLQDQAHLDQRGTLKRLILEEEAKLKAIPGQPVD